MLFREKNILSFDPRRLGWWCIGNDGDVDNKIENIYVEDIKANKMFIEWNFDTDP